MMSDDVIHLSDQLLFSVWATFSQTSLE